MAISSPRTGVGLVSSLAGACPSPLAASLAGSWVWAATALQTEAVPAQSTLCLTYFIKRQYSTFSYLAEVTFIKLHHFKLNFNYKVNCTIKLLFHETMR